jgi:hypothetical protein
MIKGALHIHSDVSPDSNLPLELIKERFKSMDYKFLLMAEHAEDLTDNKYYSLLKKCNDLSNGDFLIIPGLEIKWRDEVHFLAYGAREYVGNIYNLTLDETAKVIKEQTRCSLLAWAHFRRPATAGRSKLLQVAGLVDGIEIFNVGYHGYVLPDFSALLFLSHLKSQGMPTIALGGLDMHNLKSFGKMSCIIEPLDIPERERIFTCLKKGEFTTRARFIDLKQPCRFNFIHSRPQNRTLEGADKVMSRFSISLWETAGFSPRSFILMAASFFVSIINILIRRIEHFR